MNWDSVDFDWNQARAFLATAEEGSLSAAARVLGQTQPTLGRQVTALEEELGITLFERVGRSLMLTEAGQALLPHVRAMADAASLFSLSAAGQSQTVEGCVTITATDVVAAYHLPPILARLRDMAPGIEVRVVASNSIQDLLRREADIAIRHTRPTEPDLTARLVGETTGKLYATPDYLKKVGWPKTAEEVSRCDFVGYDNHEELIVVLNAHGLSVSRSQIRASSANGVAAWSMIRAGLGIGPMSADSAKHAPEVMPVFPELDLPVPVWLVAHRELHSSRRIRIVFDLLASSLSEGF